MLRFAPDRRLRMTCLICFAVGLGMWPTLLQAQLPSTKLQAIMPPGGQVGSETEVELFGSDFDEVDTLTFSHPGITAKQKTAEPGPFDEGPQPVERQFVVTIAKNVPPGLYEARAKGKYGLSDPRRFLVSELPAVREEENNDKLDEAQPIETPVIIDGCCARTADVDSYSFAGKKGQNLLLETWSFRLDSRLEPTLTLLNSRGRELERNRNYKRRDAVISYTLPADDTYIIQIRDSIYRNGNEYTYRLRVTQGPHIDFIFPPVAQVGQTDTFQLYGRNLPGGKVQQDIKLDGVALQRLDVKITAPSGAAAAQLDTESLVLPEDSLLDGFTYRLETPQGTSNPVFISLTNDKILTEQEANNSHDKPQQIEVPCEVAGQFYPRRDRDWYSFTAKQGDELWIEVIAQRLGIYADPVLIVEQITKKETDEGIEEQVRELTRQDDPVVNDSNASLNANIGGTMFNTTTDDPAYRFVAPADGEYRVMVRDLYSSSQLDPRFVYRLSIRKPQPDFRLVAMPTHPGTNANPTSNPPGQWTLNLRRGGAMVMEVYAFRRDKCTAPIEVTVAGLPKGVTCQGATIGEEATVAPLVIKADDSAAAWSGEIKVVGQAKIDGKPVSREARAATCVWSPVNNQSPAHVRIAKNLVLTVDANEQAPYKVEAGDGKVIATARAGKIEIPVKVTGKDIKGNISLGAHPLPTNVRLRNSNVTLNKEGKYEIDLPSTVAPGTYTLYLQARTQISYSYNPEAAEAAKERQQELDEIVKTKTEESKKATADKGAAEKAATDAAKQLTDAQTAQKSADDAVKKAETAVTQAEQKVKDAEQAAAKNPEDDGLKKALVAAESALKDAQTELAKVEQTATEAAKQVTVATEAKEKAEQAKTAATDVATQAEAMLKAAQDAQKQAAQRATTLATAARAKNINVMVPSDPITIKIDPAPFTVDDLKPIKLKQGEEAEFDVAIKRLYKFEDSVRLTLNGISGVGGIALKTVDVEKGKNSAKAQLTAATNATVGTHDFTVRATFRFNNQNMTYDLPLQVTVDEKPEEKK